MAKMVEFNTKQLYTEAIRQNITKKDWARLSDVMVEAEKAGVGKSLRAKGWYHLGLFEAERGNHPAAIVALNSARVLDSAPEKALSRMLEEMAAFYGDFEGRFSRQDLYTLSEGLERLASFHSIHSKVSASLQATQKKLAHWIERQKGNAPDKEETPASRHVQRIYAALYPPMTLEEVRAEFARIVEPLIRERLEKKGKPASGGGSKGPRDPDDEKPEPPEDKPKSKGKPKK
jgi:hypothetical protein